MRTVLFNIKEDDVAKRLGLIREEVRELRSKYLYQEEDFVKVGREICYAEDGLQKLRLVLKKIAPAGVKAGDLGVPRLNTAAATSASLGVYLADRKEGEGILDAEVTKIYPSIPTQHPQYLEATVGTKTIVIRVNSNVNFIAKEGEKPGMIIPSRLLVMKNERVFDFTGRCPRRRGRW